MYKRQVVALTVVPCAGSTVLKKQKDIKHPLFDKVLNGYEKLPSHHAGSPLSTGGRTGVLRQADSVRSLPSGWYL